MKSKSEAVEDYLVFISHSVKDRWIARQMSNLIEQKGKKYGIKTFLDEKDISGGDSIPETICENIQKCHELILLLSRYSVESTWVLIEIGAAWAHNRRIIPVIDKVTPDEMPDVIGQIKAIDLNDFDEYIKEFLGRVKGGRR